MYVSVQVDASDVLEELSDDELIAELKRRKKEPLAEPSIKPYVEELYQQWRGKEAPQALREVVWEVLGRVL